MVRHWGLSSGEELWWGRGYSPPLGGREQIQPTDMDQASLTQLERMEMGTMNNDQQKEVGKYQNGEEDDVMKSNLD